MRQKNSRFFSKASYMEGKSKNCKKKLLLFCSSILSSTNCAFAVLRQKILWRGFPVSLRTLSSLCQIYVSIFQKLPKSNEYKLENHRKSNQRSFDRIKRRVWIGRAHQLCNFLENFAHRRLFAPGGQAVKTNATVAVDVEMKHRRHKAHFRSARGIACQIQIQQKRAT